MSLTLKIEYDTEAESSRRDPSISLEASRLLTTEEVCRSVYQKLTDQGDVKLPPDSYALFWPEKKVWLQSGSHIGRMLKKSSNTRLEYRPKMRPLKIRFLDASSQEITINETATVEEVVRDVCRQLHYDHPEELSLVVAVDYAVTKHHPAKPTELTVQGISPGLGKKKQQLTGSDSSLAVSPKIRRKSVSRPASASGLRPGSAGKSRRPSSSQLIPKKKQISKKHQMRIDTPWLDPSKTLLAQDVMVEDEVILMYRFHYHTDLERESKTAELLYKQGRATFLSGELLCSQNDLVKLSALLCQITMGDFTSKEATVERVHKMKGLIVPPKCKIKNVAKEVASHHSLLKGLSACDAKNWFVKMWSSMELFGMEFFSSINTETKDSGLIGVSRHKIMFLFYNTKKKSLMWDYSSLLHWEHDSEADTVLLSFTKDGVTEHLKLSLPDYAAVLVDCLNGHRELSSSVPDLSHHKQQQEYMLSEEMEAAYHGFTAGQAGKVRPQSLTYNHIYWASMLDNPLTSEDDVKAVSWENPVFENMDKLMEERFSFLDFKEYNTDDSSTGASPAASPYPSDRLSVDSSTSASDSSLAAHQQSPLLTTRKSLSSQLLVQNGCSSTGNSPQNLREKSSRLESYSSPTISISHDSDLASYDSHVETS